MDSPEYTPRRGFWIATTLVLIVTVLPIIFLGAFSGNEGGNATNLLIHFGLVMIPSGCVALLQALMLVSPSLLARVRWFGFTLAGTAIGWGAVFALEPLLRRLIFSSTLPDQWLLAALDGFVAASPMGAIVGLVTGLIQGRNQPLSARKWLVGNLISWGLGIGIPVAVFFAGMSQIRLF